MEEVVEKYNFLGNYVTSVKTGQGVIEAFNAIIKKLYYKYKQLSSQE